MSQLIRHSPCVHVTAYAILVMFLVTWVSAFSTTSEFNTSVATVTQLVQVSADLSYPQLLPGSEYAKNVTVRFALPAESLVGLTSDRVIIHVVAYADQPSWLAFYGGDGQGYRAYAFDLDCHVQNRATGACANDSHLSRTIQAVLAVPANGTSNHSERLLVQASLLDGYQSVPLENNSPGFSQTLQNVLQNLPIQPLTQFFQQFGPSPSASPATGANPNAPGSNNTVIALDANLSASGQNRDPNGSIQLGGSNSGSSTSGSNVQGGLGAQVAQQPSVQSNPGPNEFIVPFSGLVIARGDAVLYGALIVFGLLAFLFYRHFFGGKGGKANGVFEA
ncbi:hypothetical protein HY994_06700 [Candidatus Micrarchaeota archaeon]|nr:hypothetical protein [Candidatus Micrarchaeota archaeon]